MLTILYPSFIWAHKAPSSPTRYNYPINKTYKVQWANLKEIQSPTGMYFDFSIGPGFLYFSKLKGNLTPKPSESFSNFSGVDFGNIQKFSYNKTALYEAMVSARIFPWLKCGLSFYGQSGVSVESFGGSTITSAGNPAWSIFRSDLQLYSVMFKFFLENPRPLIVGNWAFNTYFGLGVGPGWQSWTNNQVFETVIINSTLTSTQMSLRNKFSANAVWTADTGLSFTPATNDATMMIRLGCKYTSWGQMREIGELKDQEVKVAPLRPIKARNVYSFSPYIGIKWCF
ncbi:MAG: hypothetical protein S4CHLAM6_04880 [Chlamydiae bacterium]|nr:hypothetical protein [Chlamydiota bacterium]